MRYFWNNLGLRTRLKLQIWGRIVGRPMRPGKWSVPARLPTDQARINTLKSTCFSPELSLSMSQRLRYDPQPSASPMCGVYISIQKFGTLALICESNPSEEMRASHQLGQLSVTTRDHWYERISVSGEDIKKWFGSHQTPIFGERIRGSFPVNMLGTWQTRPPWTHLAYEDTLVC